VDCKRNENAGVGRLNFPVVNKSVTAKVRKVKLKVAATVNHAPEVMKN